MKAAEISSATSIDNKNIKMTARTEQNFHPKYRPDIDGLRAVAILSVVIFHAFPSQMHGGFIGVDVFFVISGFLISSIIFKGMHRGGFSFTQFYAHRIKRIFPALILVLATTFVIGWEMLLPEEMKQIGKHIFAGSAYVQNLVLWNEAGYFDTASETKPLMHLWSLAVEEQFYLIYPLLIWAAWRAGLNILTALALLSVVSFGLNIGRVDHHATEAFFSPQTRFWELLVGALLAYSELFKPGALEGVLKRVAFHSLIFRYPPILERRDDLVRSAASMIGLTLIAGGVIWFSDALRFPGWWALVPIAGSFLLIWAGPNAWVNRNILANRFMVFIGLISYPLYLWHWPLLAFLRIHANGTPPASWRITALIVSVILSYATYRLVERPLRYGKKQWNKTAALCVTSAVLAASGLWTFKKDGFPWRVSFAMSESQLDEERARYWKDTAGRPFESGKTNVLVYGDSQAHDVFHALRNDDTIGLKIIGISHQCSAFSMPDVNEDKIADQCQQAFQTLLASRELKQADVLIYTHLWLPGLEHPEFYKSGMAKILAVNPRLKVYFMSRKPIISPVGATINAITRGYQSKFGMNDYIASKVIQDDSNAYVRKIAEDTGAEFIDIKQVFCINGCVYFDDGYHSYFDEKHWTDVGARRFYERFLTTDVYRRISGRTK